MVRIVFLDIDGTVYDSRQAIPASTRYAVARLQEQGVRVVLATARSWRAARPCAEALGIYAMINFDGSYVVDGKHVIYKAPYSQTIVKRLYRAASQLGFGLTLYTVDQAYRNEYRVEKIDAFHKENNLGESLYIEHLDGIEVYGAGIFALHEEWGSHAEAFPDLTFKRVCSYAFDTALLGTSKSRAIEKMLAYYNIRCEDAMAFGDGRNDKGMLQYVGLGIAMGNAKDEVKQIADFVTKSHDEGGILYALQHLGILTL